MEVFEVSHTAKLIPFHASRMVHDQTLKGRLCVCSCVPEIVQDVGQGQCLSVLSILGSHGSVIPLGCALSSDECQEKTMLNGPSLKYSWFPPSSLFHNK